ncbi:MULTISPECIES: peptidoglycan-binding domain-containing protein [unclassified Streptomyces]|uniref:peptidoglycan-binding domain-containing protein n=1 Tax=unclassified Streptomyces TaxID=2593676 RepID=UPI0033C1C0D0
MNLLPARAAASAALTVSLLLGSAAAASAASAPAEPDLTGLSCGYDNRTPPPPVTLGAKGRTVMEARCLLTFWTGLQATEEEPRDVFGPDAESATRFFQGRRGLPETGVVDAATWTELRHS